MSAQRNVLFITIDQLRADCLTGNLASAVDLPHMRSFMAESVTFDRNFSVANPCGPSRASMLTGQYAMNHRSVRNGTPLRHDIPNVATQVRKMGYLPLLFGYTDTSQDPSAFHENDPALKSYEFPMPGFHEVTEMRLEGSYPWRSHLMKKGHAFANYWDLYKPVSPDGGTAKLNDPAVYSEQDSDTAFLTDSFLDNMRPLTQENWFAHLTYIRPHPPLVAPAPYNSMYNPTDIPLPTRMGDVKTEMGRHPFWGAVNPTDDIQKTVIGQDALDLTDLTIQTLRAIYLGLATEVDHHIGRVIAFLKETKQIDHTMIVITADHGEMLGDYHSWGKMNVYDAAFQTPLLIRLPGQKTNGKRIQEITESIDIAPTILDWLDAEIPNAMDGCSLLQLIAGETPDDWRRHSYSEIDFGAIGSPTARQKALGLRASECNLSILRDGRFNLIEFAADLPPILFDMQNQGEAMDVAGLPEYGADLMRLTRQMLRHRMRNADQTLSWTKITSEGAKTSRRHKP